VHEPAAPATVRAPLAQREADDIKSLRHGIEALRLTARRQSVSSGDLARTCAISRAAAYRVLQTLQEEGYLLRTGRGNRVRYQSSQRVRELSAGYDGGVLVLEVAIPIVLRWTLAHGWTLAITTPAGEHCICRFTTDPAAARVLIRYKAGAKMTALMSASGMVCLAFQPPEIQAEALKHLPGKPLPPYAPRRSSSELAAILDRVRRDGYATFRPIGHREAGLAVPIWLEGTMSACVSMRYMLVADGGRAGHAQRLKMLRSLCEEIGTEARRCLGR
jgi:DNA-binding IclR family transcriptional regulator